MKTIDWIIGIIILIIIANIITPSPTDLMRSSMMRGDPYEESYADRMYGDDYDYYSDYYNYDNMMYDDMRRREINRIRDNALEDMRRDAMISDMIYNDMMSDIMYDQMYEDMMRDIRYKNQRRYLES